MLMTTMIVAVLVWVFSDKPLVLWFGLCIVIALHLSNV